MDKKSAPSILGRAVLGVALLIGFYVLAIGIALFLLWVPYALVVYTGRLWIKLGIFCIVCAGVILWSLIPRRQRFVPPGPRLKAEAHPDLFKLIHEVAARTGQAVPSEVFALPDMNAWVMERGGFLGMGRKRIMGIGLPLLQVLSRVQLRAVLAHEFGHYHAGDTALGPWLYSARGAIVRTVLGLAKRSVVIMKPFLWYLQGFLRITHSISRRQEFVADALAAEVAGREAIIEGLRAIHRYSDAVMPYIYTEFAPALNSGYRPPFAEGFSRFLAAPNVAEQLEASLQKELARDASDPYDTHPSLRDRIAALETFPPSGLQNDAESAFSALSLLGNLEEVEAGIAAEIVNGKRAVRDLNPVSWEQIADRVWVPQWQQVIKAHQQALDGLTPADLLGYAGKEDALAVRLKLAPQEIDVAEEQRALAGQVVGSALTVILHARGYSVDSEPGRPVSVSINGAEARPFSLLSDLRETGARQRWQELFSASGVAGLALSSGLSSATPPATA